MEEDQERTGRKLPSGDIREQTYLLINNPFADRIHISRVDTRIFLTWKTKHSRLFGIVVFVNRHLLDNGFVSGNWKKVMEICSYNLFLTSNSWILLTIRNYWFGHKRRNLYRIEKAQCINIYNQYSSTYQIQNVNVDESENFPEMLETFIDVLLFIEAIGREFSADTLKTLAAERVN